MNTWKGLIIINLSQIEWPANVGIGDTKRFTSPVFIG